MRKLKPIKPCGDYTGNNLDICDEQDNLCNACLEKDRDQYKKAFELAMNCIDSTSKGCEEQMSCFEKLNQFTNKNINA